MFEFKTVNNKAHEMALYSVYNINYTLSVLTYHIHIVRGMMCIHCHGRGKIEKEGLSTMDCLSMHLPVLSQSPGLFNCLTT